MKTFRFTGRDGRSFIASGKDLDDALRNASVVDSPLNSVRLTKIKEISSEYLNKSLGLKYWRVRLLAGELGIEEHGIGMTNNVIEAESALRVLRDRVTELEKAISLAKEGNTKLASIKDSKVSDADTSTLLGLAQDIAEFVHNNFDRLKGKTLTEIQKEYERFKGQSWKQLPNAMMLASINFGW